LKGLDGITDPGQLESALFSFMSRVALVVFALTLVATWGIETPGRRQPLSRAEDREDAITLALAWRLITSSRQVLVFFCFLLAFTLAVFLQDPILESYGAEVFGLPIAATASLSAVWGIGTLVGLLLAGLWLVPRLGKFACARLGCQLILASLLLLTLVGVTAEPQLLKLVLFLFGLATGIGTNATLVLMLDLTLPEVAGTFVGVWGLAQAYSRAAGKVLGGGLLDLARTLSPAGSAFPPYAAVFVVEAAIAVLALVLLSRVNLRQFRDDTGRSLNRVLAMELG
jgi:BCD family chlorophyll transporter-like MFS transporter